MMLPLLISFILSAYQSSVASRCVRDTSGLIFIAELISPMLYSRRVPVACLPLKILVRCMLIFIAGCMAEPAVLVLNVAVAMQSLVLQDEKRRMVSSCP